MKKAIGVFIFLFIAVAQAQIPAKHGWQLAGERGAAVEPVTGLRSNYVSDIVVHNGEIWLGTGQGLSRSNDGGATWVTYTTRNGLPRGGVSALAVTDTIMWVATVLDSLVPEGLLPAGGGLSYSLDRGTTWQYVPQPKPFNTVIQNVTYDIALHPTGVWITSFGGSVSKSSDRGHNWVSVPPDSLFLDVANNLNHRAFSVINADGILYIGTAGGVNRSIDGGVTWTNFSHENQAQPISGNFVVALGQQKWRGREYIWGATVNAEDENEFRAISVSEDGGFSWRTTLDGDFGHNFAFDDSIAYVVTDRGLYKSIDFGRTWAKFPALKDETSGDRYLSEEFFAAGVLNQTLFVGGPDGLAASNDEGTTWQLQRGSVPAGESGALRTYAYPNPYSPFRHNQFVGDGYVRFQYQTTKPTQVTIKVFDFAMDLVAEIVSSKPRSVAGNYAEIWNGKNYRGDPVANGVYFYRVELEGDGVLWGKVMVLD
ncbi:MAG: hypothetical protein ACREOO_29285 [bacterium]